MTKKDGERYNISPKVKKKETGTAGKKAAKILVISAILLLIIWIFLAVSYAVLKRGTYLADWDTIREYGFVDGEYVMTTVDNGDAICFVPDEIKAGLIFYQDELVENSAYIPLMRRLASNGILCILPSMPLNLSNLDKNAAADLKKEYPEIKSWYIGGHGLGGEAASSFLRKNDDGFLGLILLGSYSRKNLTEASICVLSVYGSRDGVLNMKKYEKFKKNLPEEYFEEVIIEGANHSGFAAYGLHNGDNEAQIAGEKQIDITAEKIIDFMF